MKGLIIMEILSILFVISLWFLSIFVFAKYRVSRQIEEKGYADAVADWGVKIYTKISGICIVAWMCYILAV